MASMGSTQMQQTQTQPRFNWGWWIVQGGIGGFIAGVVFGLFEMIASAAVQGANAFWLPMQEISATVLGQAALEPTYSVVSAVIVGIIVELVLAVILGAIFGLIWSLFAMQPGAHSAGALLVGASVYGFLLWLLDLLIVSPAYYAWFSPTHPLVQFLAYTFFFGTVLGWYLWIVDAGRHARENAG